MASRNYDDFKKNVLRLERVFLPFKARPSGNYTKRQLAMAAAYTVFCHAEIETLLERWALDFVEFATAQWAVKKATRPLIHLCTFHKGRNAINCVPNKDIWNEVVTEAILKQRGVISSNNGIKEANFCELLSPIGFDTTLVDSILIGDLTAFGALRGQYVHNSYGSLTGTTFDPFDRRNKVEGLVALLLVLDSQLSAYLAAA